MSWIEIVLLIAGCILWAFILACGYYFWKGFFTTLWRKFKEQQRDAELWRNGQKPIGHLLSMSEDEDGLKVEGVLFKGNAGLIEASLGPFSTASDDPIPPKPEWKLKKTWFSISREELLDLDVKSWGLFTQKVGRIWINMLVNDGYTVRDTYTAWTEENKDSLLDFYKVYFEVQVYKEQPKQEYLPKPEWERSPPKGARWLTPMECHGNRGFCSSCSPRNTENRKWVVRNA